MRLDGSIRLSYFFRCVNCFKLHCRAGISPDSMCRCGFHLYRQSFEMPPAEHTILDRINSYMRIFEETGYPVGSNRD